MQPDLSAREARLRECVQKLPDEPRQVLVQYYVEGETVDVLARRQGRTVEAIYKLLQRVRRTLLECVERAEAR
jgi:RNA polymerase sigma-70 factor (ECF subfamily)